MKTTSQICCHPAISIGDKFTSTSYIERYFSTSISGATTGYIHTFILYHKRTRMKLLSPSLKGGGLKKLKFLAIFFVGNRV